MSNCDKKIILFSEKKFKGKALVFFGSELNLSDCGWASKAQSVIIIRGIWVLKKNIDDIDYPPEAHQGVGRCSDLNDWNLNKCISRIEGF